MTAIEIECHSFEWWGDQWSSPLPYSLGFATLHDSHGLPNAPVRIHVLTPDPLEAAQLLRLAAAKLEREPHLLAPLNEPGSSPNNPEVPDTENGGCPF